MQISTIAEEFLSSKTGLKEAIKSFDKKRGFSLLQSLQTEEDPINFFSALAEIRTGLFFDPWCSDLGFNTPIDRKRPDWSIWSQDQRIICEVLRLNAPQEETQASIEASRERRKFQLENPGVPFAYHYGAQITNTAYLCGAQWKLQYKEEKYRDIIVRHQLPFILCINPSFESNINEIDVSDFLMGKHGFFANDEYFGRNVAGVLLHGFFNGHWVYFPNNKAQFPLSAKNNNILSEWWI